MRIEIPACVFHTRADPNLPAFRACRDVYFKLALRKPAAQSSKDAILTVPTESMRNLEVVG